MLRQDMPVRFEEARDVTPAAEAANVWFNSGEPASVEIAENAAEPYAGGRALVKLEGCWN